MFICIENDTCMRFKIVMCRPYTLFNAQEYWTKALSLRIRNLNFRFLRQIISIY